MKTGLQKQMQKVYFRSLRRAYFQMGLSLISVFMPRPHGISYYFPAPEKLSYLHVIKLFCHIIAASKANWINESWTVEFPKRYYELFHEKLSFMHKDSQQLLEILLTLFSQAQNEKQFFDWYKNNSKIIKIIY